VQMGRTVGIDYRSAHDHIVSEEVGLLSFE